MNRKLLTLLAIILLGVAFAAQAGPKPKSTILHCGCTWDEVSAAMQYTEINISARSKGHDAHVAGTIDACFSGLLEVEPGVFQAQFTDFVRAGDDCQLSGPPLGEPITDCPLEGPVSGDSCGMEVVTP